MREEKRREERLLEGVGCCSGDWRGGRAKVSVEVLEVVGEEVKEMALLLRSGESDIVEFPLDGGSFWVVWSVFVSG